MNPGQGQCTSDRQTDRQTNRQCPLWWGIMDK